MLADGACLQVPSLPRLGVGADGVGAWVAHADVSVFEALTLHCAVQSAGKKRPKTDDPVPDTDAEVHSTEFADGTLPLPSTILLLVGPFAATPSDRNCPLLR